MTLTDNLLAYYKLDEASGNAADSSGNGYTLTNNNTVGFASALINNGGDWGTTISNKGFSTTSNLGLTSKSDFTVSMWIKMRTDLVSGTNPILFDSRNSSANSTIIFKYQNVSGTKALNLATNGNDITTNISLGTTSWHNLIVMRESGVFYIFDNTSQLISASALDIGTSGSNAFVLGNILGGGSWAGPSAYIDEVAVWQRALTSDERATIYNSGAGLSYPFTPTSTPNFLPFFQQIYN